MKAVHTSKIFTSPKSFHYRQQDQLVPPITIIAVILVKRAAALLGISRLLFIWASFGSIYKSFNDHIS